MKILNINNLNPGGLNEILAFSHKCLLNGRGAFFIPLNPIKVMKARRHVDFQSVIEHADWVFPDAWGIKWAASFLHGEKIPITPGYKLMFTMIENAEKGGYSIYFLGATSEALELASTKLKDKYPKLKIVGTHHGYFSEQEEEKVLKNIVNANPDYVFVAMGEYKQENVIQKIKRLHPRAIYAGVGGSVDLIAGNQPFPPKWARDNHLEWFYRLIRQPSRAPRFKALPMFVFLIFLEKLKMIMKIK